MVRLTLALCALRLVMIRSRHHRQSRPSHTPRWFASTPLIRESNGSDVDSPPPQTSHAESEPTTFARLWKLLMQLNTPNRLFPDLVWVSPNASDIQRWGWCVPAFRSPPLFKEWPPHIFKEQGVSRSMAAVVLCCVFCALFACRGALEGWVEFVVSRGITSTCSRLIISAHLKALILTLPAAR